MKFLAVLLVLLILPIVSADITFNYDEEFSFDDNSATIGDYTYNFYDYDGSLTINFTDSGFVIRGTETTRVSFDISRGTTSYHLVSNGRTFDSFINVDEQPRTYSLILSRNIDDIITPRVWYMNNIVAFEYDTITRSDGTLDSKVFNIPIIYFIIFMMLVAVVWYILD